MPQGDLPIYSIGAVERMLGIPAATVRNWEERYKLVNPERSGGGHRLYTRAQVEQLRFVKERLDRGLQPAEAHRLLGERLELGGDFGSMDEGESAPPCTFPVVRGTPNVRWFKDGRHGVC